MIIDCATCPVREQHCDDCMVTALLSPGVGLPLDAGEQAVVGRFVAAGLLDADRAATLRARSEPRGASVRAVG